MTYKEETYILDTLKEIQETIRSPEFKQLIKEIHENNIMLRQIIKVINTWFAHHNQENDNDFNKIFKRTFESQFKRPFFISSSKQTLTFRVQYINGYSIIYEQQDKEQFEEIIKKEHIQDNQWL